MFFGGLVLLTISGADGMLAGSVGRAGPTRELRCAAHNGGSVGRGGPTGNFRRAARGGGSVGRTGPGRNLKNTVSWVGRSGVGDMII